VDGVTPFTTEVNTDFLAIAVKRTPIATISMNSVIPAATRKAVALAAQHRPDIALVDIQMPVLDGLEATRQIVADERLASVRVVILTNFGLDEYIFAALRAGAAGFLLKDTQPAELLQALHVVMRGDALLSPAVTRRLVSEFVARPPDALAAAGMETLTGREREVAALPRVSGR
jgi:DNA-binding NarL/FixJ family response regulator